MCILIVGASNPARLIATYLKEKGKRVILIDANKDFIDQAVASDLEAFKIDIYNEDLSDNIELNDVGYLIAITGSDAVNKHALTTFSKIFGEQGSYKIASSLEAQNATIKEREEFFTPNDDFINLSEAFRENPFINEVKINSTEEYQKILELLALEEKSIPLFIEKDKDLYLVPEFEKTSEEKKGITLSYLGKKLVD